MAGFQKYNHAEFIKYLADSPEDQSAWNEFFFRFHKFIYKIVAQLCARLADRYKSFRKYFDCDDLVQEVYSNLVQNNCKALRDFKGETEFAFFTYLSSIAHNVFCNQVETFRAAKRQGITVSLDDDTKRANHENHIPLNERLESPLFDTELILDSTYLRDEIEKIVEKCARGPNQPRDCLIFKLAVFEGMRAEEIAKIVPFELTAKRIGNIASDLKQRVRAELLKRQKK
jgi:RNA polymerase sigma factor (sigma-70 family)